MVAEMSLEIREARASDDAQLRVIHLAGTMSSYGREHAWLEPILSDPATPLEAVEWTIVATEGDVVLGYAAATRNHLENLYIDPSAQGRGVGTTLLAGVEARLTGRFEVVTLRCLHANPGARRLYDRKGYAVRETQTITLHGRPLEAWLMEKPLR
jgi:ribosomal protein S18 acetylase RimI-like enzyme